MTSLNELLNQSSPSILVPNSANNIELVTSCLDNLEKHLEVLNEQKSVTLDAVEKTLSEGDGLLTYLREINKQTANPDEGNSNQETAPKSSSYAHLESVLQSVRTRYGDIDKILAGVKTKLEQYVQFKQFEKDALEASQNLEQWAEELKYLDSADAVELERSSESAESWLHAQIQTANQMQVLVFELLQRGSDLIQQCEGAAPSSGQNSFNINDLFNGSDSSSVTNGSSSGPATPTAGAATASQHTLNWLKQQNAINNFASSPSQK